MMISRLFLAGLAALALSPSASAADAEEQVFRRLVDSCAVKFSATDVARLVVSNGPDDLDEALAYARERAQKERRECLGRIGRTVASNKKRAADVAARAGRSDAETAARVAAVRAEFTASPGHYLRTAVDAQDPSGLEAMVARARSVKPLGELCPRPQRYLPTNDAQKDDYLDAYRSHENCVNAIGEQDAPELDAEELEDAIATVAAIRPYTCEARGGAPGCLSGDGWNRYARTATERNLALVQRAEKILEGREQEVANEGQYMDRKMTELRDHIERFNERRSNNYSNAWQQPEPAVPLRRPSDVSARGIR